MNIVPSITAVLFGAKRRRVSRQTTLLGGEFARKCKGERTADVRFAALAARYEDRTKPTTSLTASMVWRANFCARPAPSAKTAVNGVDRSTVAGGHAAFRFNYRIAQSHRTKRLKIKMPADALRR